MYDLLLKGGWVVDGTGAPRYGADVAVVGSEIVAIGKLDDKASKVIDASGQVVAPGFIDLHTHSDISFLVDPTAQSKVRQGVTLEFVGNCGFSICAPMAGEATRKLYDEWLRQHGVTLEPTWKDFAGYLEALEKKGATVNLVTQVGHHTVRAAVLGDEARAPTGEEMDRMKALVADALDAGALGFSSGLYYAPGYYARPEEVIELSRVAAQRDVLYSTHMRDEGEHNVGLFVALNETLEVGRRTGVRIQISHMKCSGPSVWGRAGEYLELLERRRKEGVDVAGDQYPYTAGSTFLTGAIFPRWSLADGREATLKRLKDRALRQRIHDEIAALHARFDNPDTLIFASYPPEPRYEGMSLAQVARELECDVAEAAIRLYERSEGMVIVHHMKEQDVDTFAAHPIVCVGSDGNSLSAKGPLAYGKPHPRAYATNVRYLAHFVREKKLVSLEEAIRKMTTLPASRLRLTRRGRLAPGFFADVVVFDPDKVAGRATYTNPHQYPVGVSYVFVNGTHVVEKGQFTGKTPGKVLRKSSD